MGDELIEEIFAEEANEDDEDDQREGEGEANNDNEQDKFKEEPAPTRKRRSLKPRLKFNADRLCGPRGIPTLVDHFKQVKFKGKGHLVQDLDTLMFSLKHWAHRLYPPLKFMDILKEMEKLGRKKPVQVCLTKIRQDMPILNEDFVSQEDDNHDDPQPRNADEDFDQLLREHSEAGISEVSRNENAETSTVPSTSTGGFTLTEDQKLKMQRSRQMALDRLRARQAAEAASTEDQQNTSANELDDDSPLSIENSQRKQKITSDTEEDSDDDALFSKLRGNSEKLPTARSEYSSNSPSEKNSFVETPIHVSDNDDSDLEVSQRPKKQKKIISDSEEDSDIDAEKSSFSGRGKVDSSSTSLGFIQKKRKRAISDSDDDSDMDVHTSNKQPVGNTVIKDVKSAISDSNPNFSQSNDDSDSNDSISLAALQNPMKRKKLMSDSEDDSDTEVSSKPHAINDAEELPTKNLDNSVLDDGQAGGSRSFHQPEEPNVSEDNDIQISSKSSGDSSPEKGENLPMSIDDGDVAVSLSELEELFCK